MSFEPEKHNARRPIKKSTLVVEPNRELQQAVDFLDKINRNKSNQSLTSNSCGRSPEQRAGMSLSCRGRDSRLRTGLEFRGRSVPTENLLA